VFNIYQLALLNGHFVGMSSLQYISAQETTQNFRTLFSLWLKQKKKEKRAVVPLKVIFLGKFIA